jgi:hypothetical protein
MAVPIVAKCQTKELVEAPVAGDDLFILLSESFVTICQSTDFENCCYFTRAVVKFAPYLLPAQ